MAKGLIEPHIFIASANPAKLIRNLSGILTEAELDKIRTAVNDEAKGLFALGYSHFVFAKSVDRANWRQKISRLYYAAYNIRRAISIVDGGIFSTDSSDHQKVNELPQMLNNVSIYSLKLKNLREDRNLADYSHLAIESNLLISQDNAQSTLEEFVEDAKAFLAQKGIHV
ncbi:hypothetical protein ACO0LL_24630 [Undibacterium sp. TC4M20W]|uniref:hypothetical protein n=1 Tax=Undibacterium sp. TC4M20W TaxID=3413052 RepID=UPI003BEF8803